ncbi:anti-sigma factor [Sphingobacterium corticibacter]|uniref:HEAT repeat domain-containing protein n=1 Tax=Sphingobacterium corticibacter TaxID=2171749 RepID=A0A2T8HKU6_9SPHI|nr:anti-sigma factor [Sphingobacterium corticibacter]PVH26078.1 hypothetical protein DC487_00180 [Sphingobacterium corticibacter]
MEDKLKKFVNENRQAFDRHQPSPLVWDQIKKKLPQQIEAAAEQEETITPIKRIRPARMWYAAASIVAILMVSGIIWKQYHASNAIVEEDTNAQIAQLAQPENNNSAQGSTVDQPISKVSPNKDGLTYDIDARTAQTTTRQPQKQIQENRSKHVEIEDPLAKSYALLADESSAINRMEGVLQLASMDYVPDAGMEKIQHLMASDPNENIRLAAYDIFMEHASAEQKEQQIQDAFLQQKDATMQVELMQAMAETEDLKINDATTKRLEAIVEDPLAIDLVKNQAYAVLMKNW